MPTSGGVKLVKRFGYATKTEAEAVAEHAGKLLGLATDETTRKRIGDMIATAKRGAPLPSAEDVARRIGVGLDPASTGISTGEAWHAWLAGKKRLRASSAERLEIAGRHWILPVLADVPLERLNGAHVAEVFTRIERLNSELAAKQGGSRSFVRLDGDVRTRPRHVGTASQHRVYAALREFCNFEVRKTRRLAFNPVYAVELEPEVTPEAKRWSASQAHAFLAFTKDDPLGLLFRIVLLRGARRGHREHDEDRDRRSADLAGRRDRPHPQGATHGAAQGAADGGAGESWQDNDLIFCQGDGTPYKPDAVSRRFKRLAGWPGCR